jgi:hypothetical protein
VSAGTANAKQGGLPARVSGQSVATWYLRFEGGEGLSRPYRAKLTEKKKGMGRRVPGAAQVANDKDATCFAPGWIVSQPFGLNGNDRAIQGESVRMRATRLRSGPGLTLRAGEQPRQRQQPRLTPGAS